MESWVKKHKEKFGVAPKIIGMFWDDQGQVLDGIIDAIDKGEPYDEYLMLSKEEQEAFDKGELMF